MIECCHDMISSFVPEKEAEKQKMGSFEILNTNLTYARPYVTKYQGDQLYMPRCFFTHQVVYIHVKFLYTILCQNN